MLSILLLIFNIGLFVKLEDLKNVKKFQLTKKDIGIYLFVCLLFLFLSILIALPYIQQKTIVSEKVLSEALFNEDNQILLQPVENTFFPRYNGSYILWYTKNFEDKRYLQAEKVLKVYTAQQSTLYEINNSRILSIVDAKKPLKYRGIETQSYYYSFILIIYNLVIALLAYPLYSIYENKITLLWKTQNIFSSILLAIIISSTFMF
jgi:hypothetical protein